MKAFVGLVVALSLTVMSPALQAAGRSDCYLRACTDPDGVHGSGGHGAYSISLYSTSGAEHRYAATGPSRDHYAWEWVLSCPLNNPNDAANQSICPGAHNCPDAHDLVFDVYERDTDLVPPDSWHLVGAECLGPDPTLSIRAVADAVRREFVKRVPIPTAHADPANGTLINVPTISFDGSAHTLIFPVTALGRSVTVDGHATRWTWHWHDATADTTTTDPGAAWPHQTVTHTYRQPGRYPLSVTVAWTATFRIRGIDDTFPITPAVTVTSFPVPVSVHEAQTHLVS